MRASDGLGELVEERFLNLGKLGGVHDFKNVFYFIQEHDFFGAIDLGPISEEAQNNLANVRIDTRL